MLDKMFTELKVRKDCCLLPLLLPYEFAYKILYKNNFVQKIHKTTIYEGNLRSTIIYYFMTIHIKVTSLCINGKLECMLFNLLSIAIAVYGLVWSFGKFYFIYIDIGCYLPI